MDAHYAENQVLYPVTHVEILYRWLINRGYDKEEILRGTVLTEVILTGRNQQVPFSMLEDFIQHCLTLTQDDSLGLRVGQFIGEQSPGLIGYAVKCAPTLEEALDTLKRYFQLRSPLFTISVSKNATSYQLHFNPTVDFGDAATFLQLMFVGANLSLIQQREQGLFAVKSVQLTIDKPRDLTNANSPKVSLNFNSLNNTITFNKQYLRNTSTQSDSESLHHLYEVFDKKLVLAPKDDIATQIRQQLNVHDNTSPSQGEIAKQLGLSARSFRRQLQLSNLHYKQIVNEQRVLKAIKLLKDPSLCLYQISEKMGYANLANFRRAFIQWTGKPFKDFR